MDPLIKSYRTYIDFASYFSKPAPICAGLYQRLTRGFQTESGASAVSWNADFLNQNAERVESALSAKLIAVPLAGLDALQDLAHDAGIDG